MLPKKILGTLPRSMRVIRKLIAGHREGGLTFQHTRILFLISEGMGPTQIAESMQVSLAAVSKVINGPSLKKFILKEVGEDRRSFLLRVSPEGKKILKKVSKKAEGQLDIGIKKLSPLEREKLSQGLEVLDKLMSLVKEV